MLFCSYGKLYVVNKKGNQLTINSHGTEDIQQLQILPFANFKDFLLLLFSKVLLYYIHLLYISFINVIYHFKYYQQPHCFRFFNEAIC